MRAFFVACLLAGAACAARADVVVLRNGDRVSGEVVATQGGKLMLRTAYGEIALELSEVVSIESDRPLPALAHALYTGRAALSANYASGNAPSRRFYGDAELRARAADWRYQLAGKLERRSEPGVQASSAWRASGNHDRFLDATRFAYVRGALEHDRAKDLAWRSAAGLGIGTELVRAARGGVTLRGGLDHVTERRYAGEDRGYPALGWGLKASYAPWPALELFHEHDGLRNLRASGAVLHSKSGLRVPFTAALSVTAQVNVDWESRPAPGRKSTDSTLLVGVSYAW